VIDRLFKLSPSLSISESSQSWVCDEDTLMLAGEQVAPDLVGDAVFMLRAEVAGHHVGGCGRSLLVSCECFEVLKFGIGSWY
jgi:hypothetical protein